MATEPRIALGVLTRNRPADVVSCVQSAQDTIGCELEPFVLVDDDGESLRIIQHVLTHTHLASTPLRHYYVRGYNALYRWMKQSTNLDYFVIVNDDVQFVYPDWGPFIVGKLHELFREGKGLAEMAGPELAAHYATRAAFIDTYFDGLLAEPAYTFYCSDTELRNRCKALNRYAYVESPEGPILRHLIKQDTQRSECGYWLPLDREEFKRRSHAHPEWQREVWQ